MITLIIYQIKKNIQNHKKNNKKHNTKKILKNNKTRIEKLKINIRQI